MLQIANKYLLLYEFVSPSDTCALTQILSDECCMKFNILWLEDIHGKIQAKMERVFFTPEQQTMGQMSNNPNIKWSSKQYQQQTRAQQQLQRSKVLECLSQADEEHSMLTSFNVTD